MNDGAAHPRFEALVDTMRAFAEATADYAGLLETIAERMKLIADGCVIVLIGEGRWVRPAIVSARDEEAANVLRAAVTTTEVATSSGLTMRVVRSGEPLFLPRIEAKELARMVSPPYAGAVERIGMHSVISVPLQIRARDQILGVLTLARYRADSPSFDEDDLAFACSVSTHAALALSNAQLLESLQKELRERRRAEEEAKTFVALVQNSTDFIAMARFDGQVLFVNDAGRKLLGIDRDLDARQLRLKDFHTEGGLSRADVIKAHGSWQGEGVLRHFTTGALIPTQVSSFIARDANGEPLCFATVQHDLRETKRLEAQLRQAQKMEVVGRLAGGVAHDFNNLLTVIMGYCEILAETLPAGSPDGADVSEIELAGKHAAALTRQLLAFSRQQVLEPKLLDLNTILVRMEKMLRRLIGEDVDLRTRPGSDLGQVEVDEGQIEQVILNLAVNARDAMPSGGVLSIATEAVTVGDGESDAHGGAPPGVYATIVVEDTGVGMDDATKEHLFEPFFTTKAKGKGTGLGLSTVHGILKQSKGYIAFTSAPGVGTTFRAYLPRASTEVVARLSKRPGAAAMRGTERILLVEDEAQVRMLMRNVLRKAGYDVIEASNPEDALAACARTTEEIRLLLTDVIMPKMSGRQLAERFLERRPGARVLYVSGYLPDTIRHHGVVDPGIELLQKPVTPDALLRRVREILDAAR